MKIKCAKVFFFFIATAAALFLSGCEMPVVIVSGSGNQGLTASVPVMAYA